MWHRPNSNKAAQHISDEVCNNLVSKNLYLSMVDPFFVYYPTAVDLLFCERFVDPACWKFFYESMQSALTKFYLILTQIYCKTNWKVQRQSWDNVFFQALPFENYASFIWCIRHAHARFSVWPVSPIWVKIFKNGPSKIF